MRLSRGRLLLRAALLLVAGGFMLWRGFDTRSTAGLPGVDPEGAQTLHRIALVEWVLAALALFTAGAALLSLRQRPRGPSLHLRAVPGAGEEAGEPGPPPETGGAGRAPGGDPSGQG